jgi:hypothetical protein
MHTLCDTKVTAGGSKRQDRSDRITPWNATLAWLATRNWTSMNCDIVVRASYANDCITGFKESEGPMVVPPSLMVF